MLFRKSFEHVGRSLFRRSREKLPRLKVPTPNFSDADSQLLISLSNAIRLNRAEMAPAKSQEGRKRKRKSSEKHSNGHRLKRVKSEDEDLGRPKKVSKDTLSKKKRERSKIQQIQKSQAPEPDSRESRLPDVPRAENEGIKNEDSEVLEAEKKEKAARRLDLIAKGFLPPDVQIKKSKKVETRQESPTTKGQVKRKRKTEIADQGSSDDSDKMAKAVHEEQKEIERKDKTAEQNLATSRIEKESPWNLSSHHGGRFLDASPIFSDDEKYLLVATQTTLNVYSSETSLLVRAIRIPFTSSAAGRITTYALSRADPDHVYVATSTKDLHQIDWTEGKELGRRSTGQVITEIQIADAGESEQDCLYVIGSDLERDGKDHTFHVSKILQTTWSRGDRLDADVNRLFHSKEPLHLLRIANNGEQILFAHGDILTIGLIKAGSRNYMWRDFHCSDPLTSLDVQVRRQSSRKKGNGQNSKIKPSSVDIAIGGARGAIYVYTDIMGGLFDEQGRTKDSATPLKPRILHWHREAVEAVRWSHNGNYVLSGGHEFVLLLWQVETGKRRELPHLPSTITAITVSPTGTSYALQLADNSVIVLSTSELQATTHVAGIQSRAFILEDVAAPKLQTVTSLAEASDGLFANWNGNPALVNPRDSTQLFVAVPSVQPRAGATSISSASYMQTYDIFTGRHISRQALTRNNATVKAKGPEANKLIEPNIRLMQISVDGHWLATVDEWLPPKSDMNPFAESEESELVSRKARLESYLKFWRWNEEHGHWMLETRIDMPHRSTLNPAGVTTLDLAADPTGVGFATIGEDGFVRVWRPKTNFKNGTVRRGVHEGGSVNWSCQYAVELERLTPSNAFDDDYNTHALPVNAKLAFSYDGSILAATQENPLPKTSSPVHLIDTASGTVHGSLPSLYRSGLAGMSFCDRYLIVLSKNLVVWDLAANKLAYGYFLSLPQVYRGPARFSQLAVNSTKSAFAIAVLAHPGDTKESKKQKSIKDLATIRSQLLVFDPKSPIPAFVTTTKALVLSLMPVPNSPSFMVLDSVAEIETLAPKSAAGLALRNGTKLQSMALAQAQLATIEDLEGADNGGLEDNAVGGGEKSVQRVQEDDEVSDNDIPVVRKEQLADALDLGPSFALPPPREIFEIVAKLYAGRK